MDSNYPFYDARKQYYENQMEEELDGAEKRKFKKGDEKISDCLDPRKTKMVIDFNDRESASIKSFTVRERDKIKVTTRFKSGKLLMFANLSLKIFIYDIA